jgi:aconitate hydratase
VLSGNRNFEARIHPLLKANYLASPPLVIAYALAGSITHDFNATPLGKDQAGNPVFLKDIWPTSTEARKLLKNILCPEIFLHTYNNTIDCNTRWNNLEVPKSEIFEWKAESTYIKSPPFFEGFTMEIGPVKNIEGAFCLLSLGDSVTTDHISPAGNIAKSSPAGVYLQERGVAPKDFNSYGKYFILFSFNFFRFSLRI